MGTHREDIYKDKGLDESFFEELELRSFKMVNDEEKLRKEINTRINYMLQTKFNCFLQEFHDDLVDFKEGSKVYSFTGLYEDKDVESEYKEYLQFKVLELLDDMLPKPEQGNNLVATLNLNSLDVNKKPITDKINISIERKITL